MKEIFLFGIFKNELGINFFYFFVLCVFIFNLSGVGDCLVVGIVLVLFLGVDILSVLVNGVFVFKWVVELVFNVLLNLDFVLVVGKLFLFFLCLVLLFRFYL